MVQDIDIKSKRILLFDFDGTLIETASGNTFATDLTDMRIKKLGLFLELIEAKIEYVLWGAYMIWR